MKKFAIVLLVIVVILLSYLVYHSLETSNALSGELKIQKSTKTLISQSKKIESYKIIIPVENETRGVFSFTVEGSEPKDPIRIPTAKAAAILALLQHGDVYYNQETSSLIVESK